MKITELTYHKIGSVHRIYEDATSDEWEASLPRDAVVWAPEDDSGCAAYSPLGDYYGVWYPSGDAYIWEPTNGSLRP